MGLDLYHLKATLHPEDHDEAFTFCEDDFDEHALDVLGFRRFIQVIPDTDYPTRIVIVKDERGAGHPPLERLVAKQGGHHPAGR